MRVNLAHVHSSTQSERTFPTEIYVLRGNSTPRALLGFATSGVHPVSFFHLLPVSACGPDRVLLWPHCPLQQLVILLASRALLPFLPSSFPRVRCATSLSVTTPLHPFRQRRSRRCACCPFCRWRSATADSGCPLAFLGRMSDIVLDLVSCISVAPRHPALVGRPDPSRSTESKLVMCHP